MAVRTFTSLNFIKFCSIVPSFVVFCFCCYDDRFGVSEKAKKPNCQNGFVTYFVLAFRAVVAVVMDV